MTRKDMVLLKQKTMEIFLYIILVLKIPVAFVHYRKERRWTFI